MIANPLTPRGNRLNQIRFTTFNGSKKTIVLLAVFLSFIAVSLRADDSVVQSSGDLSAGDKVAAEHLQKQMDAEEKTAHDKAESDWQKEHSPGGSGMDWLGPVFLVLMVGGAFIYCKVAK